MNGWRPQHGPLAAVQELRLQTRRTRRRGHGVRRPLPAESALAARIAHHDGREPRVSEWLAAHEEVHGEADIRRHVERWLPAYGRPRSYVTVASAAPAAITAAYLAEHLGEYFARRAAGSNRARRRSAPDIGRSAPRPGTPDHAQTHPRHRQQARPARPRGRTVRRSPAPTAHTSASRRRRADGKSIMAVMMLAAAKGSQITVETEGADDAALDAIADLADRFGEEV